MTKGQNYQSINDGIVIYRSRRNELPFRVEGADYLSMESTINNTCTWLSKHSRIKRWNSRRFDRGEEFAQRSYFGDPVNSGRRIQQMFDSTPRMWWSLYEGSELPITRRYCYLSQRWRNSNLSAEGASYLFNGTHAPITTGSLEGKRRTMTISLSHLSDHLSTGLDRWIVRWNEGLVSNCLIEYESEYGQANSSYADTSVNNAKSHSCQQIIRQKTGSFNKKQISELTEVNIADKHYGTNASPTNIVRRRRTKLSK